MCTEKKSEEIVDLAISINQEFLKSIEKISDSYYGSFIDLKEFRIFSVDELEELASTVNFRNKLMDEYLEVNEEVAVNSMNRMCVIYPLYVKKMKIFLDKKR